jgi:hypothetical protein
MVVAPAAQGFSRRAGVVVLLGVVDELLYGEQSGTLFLICQRGVGADARLLYGRNVLPRSVGGVSCDRTWMQAPTEPAPEEHLQHGEVLGDLRSRDQHVQDHPRLTAIHGVVREVTEPACVLLLLVHRRGVGVCGTHP